jgi:hydroxysqualene synthase
VVSASAQSRAALEEAYAACARLARHHYENFPVASRLLPSAMRPHVAAVYAFARVADDFADEGDRTIEERHRLLDRWLALLRRCAIDGDGGDPAPAVCPGEAGLEAHSTHEIREGTEAVTEADAARIFLALADSIHACRLPASLFEDLLSAFRQDVTVRRYATWADLLDYCRRSANPVGRLVLRIAGYDDPALDLSSDALCTALQLTNFWQDLERDWHKGRLYVPFEDAQACGALEADLDRRVVTPEWQHVLGRLSERTRALFVRGRDVCDEVSGRLRLELRLTWLGGSTILSRLERANFNVFRSRPALSPVDVPTLAWQALRWRAGPRQTRS